MREILFRGKRIDNGEWIKGFYYQKPNVCAEDGKPVKHYISDLPPFGAEIIPATVGQYTGLQDKRGQRIFEGDIVEIRFDRSVCPEVVGEVYFINGGFHIRSLDAGLSLLVYVQYCEIIGKIHDNPELLEVHHA